MKKIITLSIAAISFNLALSAGMHNTMHDDMVAQQMPSEVQAELASHTMLGQGGAGTRQMMGSNPATWSQSKRVNNSTGQDIIVRIETTTVNGQGSQTRLKDEFLKQGASLDLPPESNASIRITPVKVSDSSEGNTLEVQEADSIINIKPGDLEPQMQTQHAKFGYATFGQRNSKKK